jgi:molybdopterin-binding protein
LRTIVILGAVNAEVIIELPGGDQITSIVTNGAVSALAIAEEKQLMQSSKRPT